MRLSKLQLVLFLYGILFITSCSKKDSGTNTPQYNRVPFLTNIGNSIIIPQYLDLKNKMDSLSVYGTAFVNSPSTTTLTNVRSAFINAYKSWEGSAHVDFGPALTLNLSTTYVNIFPTDTTVINTNISQGNYSLTSSNAPNFSGFPAIDFLLFNKKMSDQQLINAYTSIPAKGTYLTALISLLQTQVTNTYTQWIPGQGNYIQSFTSNSGVDEGSSTSNLLNRMCYDLDVIKNDKLGIPLGLVVSVGAVSGAPNPAPQEAEAYFSDSSIALLKQSIISLNNMYIGRTASGKDSTGFDDYLISINNASLNTTILNQFNVVLTQLNTIPQPFSASLLNSGNSAIYNTYLDVAHLLAYLKVDLASAINVQIDYPDNDGD